MARKAKKAADSEAKLRAAEEDADHVPAITPPDYDTALDTGSTLLNLAITGRPPTAAGCEGSTTSSPARRTPGSHFS